MICALCGREVDLTTFHHLIPCTLHTKKWWQDRYTWEELKTLGLDLCVLCHHAVHDFYDEKTLGKEYYTRELLLTSDLIQKHIKWAHKQK